MLLVCVMLTQYLQQRAMLARLVHVFVKSFAPLVKIHGFWFLPVIEFVSPVVCSSSAFLLQISEASATPNVQNIIVSHAQIKRHALECDSLAVLRTPSWILLSFCLGRSMRVFLDRIHDSTLLKVVFCFWRIGLLRVRGLQRIFG